jgi:hypothetical protein
MQGTDRREDEQNTQLHTEIKTREWGTLGERNRAKEENEQQKRGQKIQMDE